MYLHCAVSLIILQKVITAIKRLGSYIQAYQRLIRFCGAFLFVSSKYLCHVNLLHLLKEHINSLPTSVVCWLPLQTVWTQIRPDKMSGLIWMQTVWHSDGIPERIFRKMCFWKQSADDKNTKLTSMQIACKTILRGSILVWLWLSCWQFFGEGTNR